MARIQHEIPKECDFCKEKAEFFLLKYNEFFGGLTYNHVCKKHKLDFQHGILKLR